VVVILGNEGGAHAARRDAGEGRGIGERRHKRREQRKTRDGGEKSAMEVRKKEKAASPGK